MTRIQIHFPDKINFTTKIALQISDFNYGNHLSNDAVLRVMHEARMQFFKHIQCTELSFFGSAIIMADVAVQYKAEGFYGDHLEIKISVSDIHKYGFDLLYKGTAIERKKEIFIAKAGIVCFNYQSHKIQQLPQAFVNILN